MATGVRGKEKQGDDALTAAMSTHLDPHPLPEPNSEVRLSYPDKLDRGQVISPLPASFLALESQGAASPVERIGPDAFVLSDNLFALHNLVESGQRAALIYLDPPYGTGMEFHSRGLRHAYKDDQAPAAYLEFMRRRLILMRELLGEDGSLYLHIGHQMLFHMKVILDEVFGPKNFRNMIVRRKCSSKNYTRRSYPNLHDYILFYTKSAKYIWNRPGETPDEKWIEKEYPKRDGRGQYKLVPVHAPGTRQGETGKPWRDRLPPPGKHWQYRPDRLDELDNNGEIHWSRNGNPRRKVYLRPDTTLPRTDYWTKFRDAHHQSIRITGYPTEKNLEMLRVIVGASSNQGDLVIDPFCGSGTCLHASHDMGRRWIGIDASFSAGQAPVQRLRRGLQPMGDYINSPSGKGDSGDLFDWASDGENSRCGPLSLDFQFIVDRAIAEQFPGELSALLSAVSPRHEEEDKQP